jgi:catechol 2,3-dioxygenase-like lactoylglutathione lyase family enzyme
MHAIGATGVDHVVALTPDLDRTTAKLRAAGFDHRATRGRQAFFVIGACLLELVGQADGHATVWGLTLVVEDLDEAARQLGDRLGPAKDAVQPGRRIATVRSREAGLTTALALMSPR